MFDGYFKHFLHFAQQYCLAITVNVKKRWKYLLLLWLMVLAIYVYLGGSIIFIPKTLLIITGLIGSLAVCVDGKIHNKVCTMIILMGSIFAFITPVLDAPDENAHYSRALYISEGHLYLPSKPKEFQVSKDVVIADKVMKTPLIKSGLDKVRTSSDKAYYPQFVATNASSFVPYLPQVVGILIAKILGLSVFASILLGRLSNLIVYSLLVRLAIKKSNGKELLFSTIAMIPMAVYLASSFSTDGMANGLTFLLLGTFCSLVGQNKVDMKDICIFASLCLLMATIKLPYVLLVGLLLFIPKNKFKSRHIYLYIITAIVFVAIISFLWLRLSSGINITQVNDVANPVEKLKYTFAHLKTFSLFSFKELINLIPNLLPSLFTFGWLSYGLGNLMWFYLPFIACIIFMIPQYNPLPTFSKFGTLLVGFGITLGILMTAYLMWGKVTEMSFNGIQGRYFIGVILSMGLALNVSHFYVPIPVVLTNEEEERRDSLVLFIALLFIVMSIVLTILEYYGVKA